VKSGPKAAADTSVLPFRPRSVGAARFGKFSERFLLVPKGTGAKSPLKPRPWQLDLVGTMLDDPRPRFGLWVMPRGCGKSTLVAALGLHHVFDSGIEGARAVVVAQDERSALRMLATATRMVETSEELSKRCRVYKDRIVVERTDSSMVALPGESHRIEGEQASLGICEEIGVVRRDAFESLLHSTGKDAAAQLLAIGTPSPPAWRDLSPMLDLVLDGRARPNDPDFRLVEFGGDITHPVDCLHCWEAAVPGLDDLVSREHMRASLPPRSRESEYRRARLAEWVEHDDAAFLPPGVWDKLGTGEEIPWGSDVVVSLDGSFNGDSTALLLATVSQTPHLDVLGLWASEDEDSTWRVPILEVEQTIREACKKFNVLEVVADPFRWSRSLQILESEGLPVTEFNQTPARLTPATTDTYQACINGELTHSGNPDLARHVANAVVTEDARGVRLAKEKRGSRRRIDLAVTVVMAHSRATWRATRKPTRKRVRGFK